MTFLEKYGPWAVIAGASEGTGREFALQIAREGVNCLLVARREAPLRELSEQIIAETGVQCLTLSADLSQPDAFERLREAAGEREVGLFISNAGADPNASEFLDRDIETWDYLVGRNIVTSVRACHHFGSGMRERGRGGLLLVGSGACIGGGPTLAMYSGIKAFDLCFAEGLWAELQPHGIDVLCLVMTTTDTPMLAALIERKGLKRPAQIAAAAEVAAAGLARLPHGPVHFWGLEDEETGWAISSAAQRRARVSMMAEATRATFSGQGEA
jgi:short-subunit dehydrogenase